MSANPRLAALSEAGVSIWLDDLNRELISSGRLARLVEEYSVVGVTTNPTIFATALADGEAYADQVAELSKNGASVDEAILTLTTDDVRDACDVFMPVYEATGGVDGRVSIEVDPGLAHDTAGTVESAELLWRTVDRPNLLVKIPATDEGLPAISQVLAKGISVNVTLIFSVDRYRGVLNAFLTGLEQAREHGVDLSTIHSVASFFVSRLDTDVDARLDAIGSEEALALKGKAALANARLAHRAFESVRDTPRWRTLADDGAHLQRPLWASTGVKDPDYPDTMYLTGLVTEDVVNTMPAATLEAFADHGEVAGDTVTGRAEESEAVLDDLERLGISYPEVIAKLEREGVEKFVGSWGELTGTVQRALEKGE
ncbi:transaldolase [Mobilicoccus pelagius]|uniref:Transaldolase n=1 Tax=Mobilicoccus pelagius NBRC 104925 TaxID=1089455 RepID=H5UTN5_9MICO|nr:transaldolase [Mobilicoccus pelagius]GAB49093.1 transaldolase [Mobilicoccus pelagius NBRC 104925]